MAGKDDRVFELRSEYENVQKRTFTKWANAHLKALHMNIADLYMDLRDGRLLIALLERLSNEMLVRHQCTCLSFYHITPLPWAVVLCVTLRSRVSSFVYHTFSHVPPEATSVSIALRVSIKLSIS